MAATAAGDGKKHAEGKGKKENREQEEK